MANNCELCAAPNALGLRIFSTYALQVAPKHLAQHKQ